MLDPEPTMPTPARPTDTAPRAELPLVREPFSSLHESFPSSSSFEESFQAGLRESFSPSLRESAPLVLRPLPEPSTRNDTREPVRLLPAAPPPEPDDPAVQKDAIGHVVWLAMLQSVRNALPPFVQEAYIAVSGAPETDSARAGFEVRLKLSSAPPPKALGQLKHSLETLLHAPVTLKVERPGPEAPVRPRDRRSTPPRRPHHGHALGGAREGYEASLEDAIRATLPEGIHARKLSLYEVPFGKRFSRFALLKVRIDSVPLEDLQAWRSDIERRFDVFLTLQQERVTVGLERQLAHAADADGVIRNAARVRKMKEQIHGPVPSVVSQEPPRELLQRLRDITPMRLVTLDPPGSKDLDDALFAEKLPNGNMKVTVTFADVSWRIPRGSDIDEYARRAAFSLYGTRTVVPILGPTLSEQDLSLLPGRNRVMWAVELEIDPSGKIVANDVYHAWGSSKRRFSYAEATGILHDASSTDEYRETLENLSEASQRLHANRFSRASLVKMETGPSERVVEEFMLAAKSVLAQRFTAARVPIIYKVHSLPSREQRRVFLHELRELGINAGSGDLTEPRRFCAVLGCLRDLGAQELLDRMLDAYLGRARYDTRNSGHMGLNLEAYMEIKGLRNYAGLANQWQLAHLIDGTPGVPPPVLRRLCRNVNRLSKAYADRTFKLLRLERIEDELRGRGSIEDVSVVRAGGGGLLVERTGTDRYGVLRLPHGAAAGFKPGDRIPVMLDGYDAERERVVFAPLAN